MSYRSEEEARLIRQSSKQAIALAMEGRWREAVETNKSIIENFPGDVDAYNRLGRAYMELGEYLKAREAYSRAKELDPYNAIAEKNLRRLSHLGAAVVEEDSFDRVEPRHFIEETGKAGVVRLYSLAPEEILARMVAGDRVYLRIDGANLVVENGHEEYLGQVEPKNAQRLIKLIKGGNRYMAAVVSSSEDMLVVIIREVYQHPSQVEQLSFPARGVEGSGPYDGDRIFKRQLKYEAAGEPDFPSVGGDEVESLSGEPTEGDTSDSGEDEEQED
jgi:tetratricopeptide (TPR) repeat protein